VAEERMTSQPTLAIDSTATAREMFIDIPSGWEMRRTPLPFADH